MKRFVIFSLTFALLFGCVPRNMDAEANTAKKPKNFIMMVMDGTNSDAVTLARWYKGGKLALDDILAGGARTYSYHSAITDSAAAGTALATGRKSIVHSIGMAPADGRGMISDGNNGNKEQERTISPEQLGRSLMPAASILEAAKKAGKAAGIVATSPVQHATPAAFSTHVANRSLMEDIAEQQVYQGLDVVLGGGLQYLLPESRRDGENLVKTIFNSGYVFADKKSMMEQASPGKLWGAFSPTAIANEFDRKQFFPQQPSLAEMTGKALSSLKKDKDGFFLFVEGSKVDWAAHQNDPVGMVSEILSFDAAVKQAVDFAKKDGETLVIAVTDHGNSGLTIGSRKTDKTYAVSEPSAFIKPLKKAKITLEGAMWLLKKDRSNLREVAGMYGLDHLSRDEWQRLERAGSDLQVGKELTRLLGKRAKLGFTTYGHTGEDVFLYAFGPGRPTGLINNIDIAPLVAGFWGIDLAALSKEKFVVAADFYRNKGYSVRIDDTDSANPILVAERPGVKLTYPAHKNFHYNNGKAVKQTGITVYGGGKFYIPREMGTVPHSP
ncbi:alkaline phosphatase [Peribacillus deserti]|uniref:Alkaline phosphatase n=1 Tax=Peribacillus deserti TaxID=673318 RepID=A0ABS2QDZ8_9BACI|nr:alkaline phosphatase [Peribacillus deserti]MBM7690728.1 alkaline phosphatase [Peribacillus deserti]